MPRNIKQPMQPIWIDEHGVVRFRANSIVQWLFDSGKLDLNATALLPNVSQADHEQLAQLLGYSVSGFGDLSYASSETVAKADAKAAALLAAERRRKRAGRRA